LERSPVQSSQKRLGTLAFGADVEGRDLSAARSGALGDLAADLDMLSCRLSAFGLLFVGLFTTFAI
jgi:hypothetical protein